MKFMLKTLLFALLSTHSLYAFNTKDSGDILLAALASSAYGSTFYCDDKEGREMYYKSFLANTLLTYGLKYSINRTRPNGEEHSFPSGHSSLSFQSASFIHKRYGLSYASIAYLGAMFVGYSRVDAGVHYKSDVIAGAVIGVCSSFYFTKKYKNISLEPIANGYGVMIKTKF